MKELEQLPGTENFGEHTFERPSLELQNYLIEHAKETSDMSEMEWVERYSLEFRKLFNDPDEKIYQRFRDEAYDKNPGKFLDEIQRKLDERISDSKK